MSGLAAAMIWRIAILFAELEILILIKRHFSYLRRSLAIFFLTEEGRTAGSVNGKTRVELAMFMLGTTLTSPTSTSRWMKMLASLENELSNTTSKCDPYLSEKGSEKSKSLVLTNDS